eukprot:symbB.v1.2.007767.t1/scaffold480.1/size253386/29
MANQRRATVHCWRFGIHRSCRSFKGLDAVSVLCQAAANQAEEIRCLECVGHVSDIPFPPSSPTLDAMVAVLQARLVTPWRNGSMRYCRTRVRASSEQAFCKAAAITVPA